MKKDDLNDNVLVILQKAADVVEKGWAQKASARDADGNQVNPYGEEGVSFCATGAIQKASYVAIRGNTNTLNAERLISICWATKRTTLMVFMNFLATGTIRKGAQKKKFLMR